MKSGDALAKIPTKSKRPYILKLALIFDKEFNFFFYLKVNFKLVSTSSVSLSTKEKKSWEGMHVSSHLSSTHGFFNNAYVLISK